MSPLTNITIATILTFVSAAALAIGSAALRFAMSIKTDLTAYKGKVDILFGFWEKEVLDAMSILHKPHPEAKELDELLDKFKILLQKFSQQTLNDDELIQFVKLLESVRGNSSIASGDRLAASRVLNYIEMRHKMMQLGL